MILELTFPAVANNGLSTPLPYFRLFLDVLLPIALQSIFLCRIDCADKLKLFSEQWHNSMQKPNNGVALKLST